MPLIHDIVFADSAQREDVLNAADHRQAFAGVPNFGLSIDDVVTLVAAHQRVERDNPAWRALRRQVYGGFQERYREPDCSVAELSATICEEIADWAELPTTQLAAKTGLAESAVRALIAACVTARDQGPFSRRRIARLLGR